MAKYLRSVPYFIEAKTPTELVKKMLQNNIENNQIFQYENIIFNGKTYIVWFAVSMDDVLKTLKVELLAKDKIKNTAIIKAKIKTKTGK